MQNSPEEFIATLVHPDEYMRHLNQIAGVTTKNIIFLKRKFVSKSGWELSSYPVGDCIRIVHHDEHPLFTIISGVLLIILISFIFYMLFVNWDNLEPQTRVPIGALGLAGLYGLRWAFGSRRHRITFVLKDKTTLVWKSRSGDYQYKHASVQKVMEYAKSAGLLGTTT